MTYGSGDYTYELAENWGALPDGYEFNQVAGVAVDKSDRVFVFNRSRHQMIVLDREGKFVGSWDEHFENPHGIHIGPDGNVYLADRDAHVILVYNADGKLQLTLGTRGRPSDTGYDPDEKIVKQVAGPFNLPTGIAVSEDGFIFVSDGYGNARVHKYNSNGRHLMSWGVAGKLNPGQFHLPHGIVLNNDGMLLICDRENNRIQIFDQDGDYEGMISNLLQPTDVCVGPDDEIYVSELGHRLTILDADGKVASRWGGESSHDPGQFVAPHGVAIDSHGDIYVGEVLEGKRIQKFVRKR